MEIENKIKEEIEKLRPYLQGDGGDIEFVKYEEGNVYVRLNGACAGCSLIDVTLKDGVEEILTSEIPEVKQVIKVDYIHKKISIIKLIFFYAIFKNSTFGIANESLKSSNDLLSSVEAF